MKELTNEELHNRQMYYQGYLQCFADLKSLAREYISNNDTHMVYIEEDELDSIYEAVEKCVHKSFDIGYMYYDEEDKKLKFKEELDEV